MCGGDSVNIYFKQWVLETIPTMEGEFTSQQILAKIISTHKNGPYIGNTREIGYILRRFTNCTQNGNGTWRHKDE